MLHGANLSFKLWPWAINNCLLLHNMVPHGDRGGPIIWIGGKQPDVAQIRTFGCQVYVRPPGKCPSKLEPHVNEGTYLGPTATFTQAHYQDHRTLKFKTSAHVRYDEGMNGSATPTPNSHQLHTALGRQLPPEIELSKLPHDPIVSLAFPFTELVTVTVPIRCDHVSIGLHLGTCATRSRVYISDIDPSSTCSKIRDWRRKYKGEYVVQINGCLVFSESSALQQLARVVKSAPTASTPMLELIVAPDTPPSLPPTPIRWHASSSTGLISHSDQYTVRNGGGYSDANC
jgi:hypothetical protein